MLYEEEDTELTTLPSKKFLNSLLKFISYIIPQGERII